jgi:hypothetical protein
VTVRKRASPGFFTQTLTVAHALAFNVGGSYSAGIEINRARESIGVARAAPRQDIQDPYNPIVAAGIIVDVDSAKFDGGIAVPIASLLRNGIFADSDCFLSGEPARRTIALTFNDRWRSGCVAFSPFQVESVAFPSILPVFNPDDCGRPAIRAAQQILPASAVDSSKAETSGFSRHGPIALEPPPFGRLSAYSAERCGIATNFNFGDAIHDNFNGALSAVAIAPAGDRCPARYRLGVRRSG